MSKMTLNFSPLTERVFLGRVNPKTGVSIGEQRDVTSEFLQIMEMKFPVNTTQLVSVNGENKYRVIVVDLDKSVVVGEKVIQEGSSPSTIGAPVSQWIPVSERLPEGNGSVEFYSDDLRNPVCHVIGYYKGGKWFFTGKEFVNVTHWKPATAAPKEQSCDE